MKEKVAVATVQGKAYFLIVNALREQNIPFISLLPGEPVPAKVKAVITTEQEKGLVKHEKIFVFHDEAELDSLISEVKIALLGQEASERIVIGIDPGEATGMSVSADGKAIEEGNFYST
jgi:predicted RNase H-like nuclease (RuvC/YqgF family)